MYPVYQCNGPGLSSGVWGDLSSTIFTMLDRSTGSWQLTIPGPYTNPSSILQLRATLNLQQEYSSWFRIYVNMAPLCDSEVPTPPSLPASYDPFPNKVLIDGSTHTGASSMSPFVSQYCPQKCPMNDGVSFQDDCTFTHSIECHDLAIPLVKFDANTNSVTTVLQVQLDKTLKPTVSTSDALVVGKTWVCNLKGVADKSGKSAVTVDTFNIEFKGCGVRSVCDISSFTPIPVSDLFSQVVISYASASQSPTFTTFKDMLTPDCTASSDCHSYLTYAILLDQCDACSTYKDTAICSSSCTNFVKYTPPVGTLVTFTEADSVGAPGVLHFDLTSGFNELKHYVAKIQMTYMHMDGIYSTAQTSETFLWLVDGHSQCSAANLITPDASDVPTFTSNGGKIKIQTGTTWSDTGFTVPKNDVCPEFCLTAGQNCGSTTYSLECYGSNDPGTIFDFNSKTGQSVTFNTSADPVLVGIEATDVSSLLDSWQCRIVYTLDASSSTVRGAYFPVVFDPCNFKPYCDHVKYNNMPVGAEPLTSYTKYSSAIWSNKFTTFTDSLTSECTVQQDCHDQLTLSIELDNCDACANNNCVLGSCTDFVALTETTTFNEQTSVGSGEYKFKVDSGIQVLKNHYARIKGFHASSGQTVYSEPFRLYTIAYDECTTLATLNQPLVTNLPAFSSKIPFGGTSTQSSTGFTQFGNSICPEFCYSTQSCGQEAYILNCRDKNNVSGPYFDPATNSGSEGQFTYTISTGTTKQISISSNDPQVVPIEFMCTVQAQHSLSLDIKNTQEFLVQFDPCADPTNACSLLNFWEISLLKKVPNWENPSPINVYLYADPFDVVLDFSLWTDYFSDVCSPDVCGERNFALEQISNVPNSPISFMHTEVFDGLEDKITLTLGTDLISEMGQYELKVKGQQLFPADSSYLKEVYFWPIRVNILDPCELLEFQVNRKTQINKIQDIELLLDNTEVTREHTAFTNNVTEAYYDKLTLSGPIVWPLCGFATHYQLTKPDGAALPIDCPVTMDSSTGKVTVSCASANTAFDLLNFQVAIMAYTLDTQLKIKAQGFSDPFQLKMTAPILPVDSSSNDKGNAPKFVSFPADQTFDNQIGTTVSLTLEATDDDGDIVDLVVELGSSSSFVSSSAVSLTKQELTITVDNKVAPDTFTITATAKDKKGNTKAQTLTLTVTGVDPVTESSDSDSENAFKFTFKAKSDSDKIEEKEVEEKEPLRAWIDSISSSGEMIIAWNDYTLVDETQSEIKADDFHIVFTQLSDEEDQTREFRYKLNSWEPSLAKVQLTFAKPLFVSAGLAFDKVTVYMRKDMFMVRDEQEAWKSFGKSDTKADTDSEIAQLNAESKKRILAQNYGNQEVFEKLTSVVPLQVEKAAAEQIASQAESNKGLLQVAFWAPFVIQFAMSAAMSHVWNLLNTLQIVNTFPLFSLQTPENVKQILVATNDIAQMKIIDKEKVFGFVKQYFEIDPKKNSALKEQNDKNTISTAEVFAKDLNQKSQTSQSRRLQETVQIGQTDQKGQNSEELVSQKDQTLKEFGLGSSDILQAAVQLLMGLIIAALLLLLIKYFQEYVLHRMPRFVQNFFKMINRKLQYNAILRTAIESYYGICMSVCLNIKANHNFQWETSGQIINMFSRLFFVPFLIGFPIWVNWFLKRNRFRLSDPDFQGRYNTLYLNVDYFKKQGLPFTAYLLARRLFMVIVAVFFGVSPIIQVAIAMYTSQLMCQFFVRFMPMIDAMNNSIQVFNEWMILSYTIMLMNFTDYNPSPEVRFEIGWFYIYMLYANIGANVLVILAAMGYKVKHTIKQRQRIKKAREAIEQRNKHNRLILKLGKSLPTKILQSKLQKDPNRSNESLPAISEISAEMEEMRQEIHQEINKKPKQKSSLQKRRDAKERFFKFIEDAREQDKQKVLQELEEENENSRNKPSKLLQVDNENGLNSKMQANFGPDQEEWEKHVWNDLVTDEVGNVMKLKQGKSGTQIEDWQLLESQFQKDRKRLQQHTDWPLSARGMEELIQKQKAYEVKKQIQIQRQEDEEIENHSNRFSWDGEANKEEKGDIDDWAVHIDDEVVAAISPPKYDKKRQKAQNQMKVSQQAISQQQEKSITKDKQERLLKMRQASMGDSFFSGDNLDFSQNFEDSSKKRLVKNKSGKNTKDKKTEIWSNSSFDSESKDMSIADLSDFNYRQQNGKVMPNALISKGHKNQSRQQISHTKQLYCSEYYNDKAELRDRYENDDEEEEAISQVEQMFGGGQGRQKGRRLRSRGEVADSMRDTQFSQATKYTVQSVNLYGAGSSNVSSSNKHFVRKSKNAKMVNDGRAKKHIQDDIFE